MKINPEWVEMKMLNRNMTQSRATMLLACSMALVLLTGCVSGIKTSDRTFEKIYFSHSIDNAPSPKFFKQLEQTDADSPTVGELSTPEVVLYFDNDSEIVRSEDIERLQSFLLNFPPQTMPVFLITGHTDSNHSDVYNIGLSDRRAKSTQMQMLRMGVPITQTALRGLGESTPVASNTSDDGRQTNRRVTIRAIN